MRHTCRQPGAVSAGSGGGDVDVTRTPGRPRQTTHAEIRDVARRLFAEAGYDRVSLARIASAAGISRTTLFSYYQAKADLMAEEMEAHSAAALAYLAGEPAGTVLDVVAEAILVAARYPIADHVDFAQRRSICRASAELTAHVTRHVAQLTASLAEFASERVAPEERTLARDLTHALTAVSSQAIDDWSQQPPEQPLDDYVSARLRPLLEACRHLLSEGPTP